MSEDRESNGGNRGQRHEHLMARGHERYRLSRIPTAGLERAVTCRLEHDGRDICTLRVLDASPTGLGVAMPSEAGFSPPSGTMRAIVRFGGEDIFSGDAVLIRHEDAAAPRLGVRFVSDLLDVGRIGLAHKLATTIGAEAEARDRLRPEWRAGVADVRRLLCAVREQTRALDLAEVSEDVQKERIRTIHGEVGPTFYRLLASLHELSLGFDPKTEETARRYATSELLDLVRECPMHRRAFEKPRKYAGDYRMMTMYFAERLEGDTTFGKLLHYTAQRYTLGRTVVAREQTMRDVVAATCAATKGTARIVSLTCGPAIELENLLRAGGKGLGAMELVLVDQDEKALEHCIRRLHEVLVQDEDLRASVVLRPLHLSVKQLLEGTYDSAGTYVRSMLSDVDLVYAAGLLDYLPDQWAGALLARAWAMLGRGGRMFIGNLCPAPDTSWMMTYVLEWILCYRESSDLRRLASRLDPKPARLDIATDATECCFFLDAVRG